ncbi:Rrf2 family transcriptional regulator [uncultured Croceitalea sp.]|uniref:RrF2 family transcriptional regulator n=1 Tax=uncultured Croceitalea sp. TaxID=1798908 RepID=UPI0033067DB4
MFSTSSKYAVKALLYIALNAAEGKRILAKDISGPMNIPKAYLSKLLQDLSKHNMVSSVRGPGGGFYLTEDNMKVPLIEIIQVIDGDSRLNSCLLSLTNCDAEKPCPLHDIVGDSKAHFVKNLQENCIGDLVDGIKEGRSVLPI